MVIKKGVFDIKWKLKRLTVRRVQFDAVRRGRPVRSPFDAELVMVDVVGLNVGHIQVDCRGRKIHITTNETYERDSFRVSLHTVTVRTCCSLPRERCTAAPEVLSHHLQVVGGSRQQVVQSVRGHVAHKEVYWSICAWKDLKNKRLGCAWVNHV